jgi:ketosteroid isomerase-like protein
VDRAVREFFAALEAMDIPRFLRVWADDGVQEMPFAPGSFPRRLEGRAAIERQYGPLPAAFTSMRFPVRRIVPAHTPGLVLVEYDGSIVLKAGGQYDNRYVGIFQFDERGRLAHFTEYFDPLTLIRGFPGAAALARSDEEQIRGAVAALASAADRRDWRGVGAVFAEHVDVDYTSVAGGTPGRVARADLVAGWQQGLERYEVTTHHFSEAQVTLTGDTARARFTGQATHRKANGDRWSCGGDYEYQFVRTPDGWKARGATFRMQWEQGVR